MMFPSFSTLFALVAASHLVSASSVIPREEFIVYNPYIISPTVGDAWVSGTQKTVTWSTAGMPSEVAASTGVLLLGYNENGSENLDTEHPLASSFPMKAGQVAFTVPQVASRVDYIVVLFGDSGNQSPAFAITNTTGPNTVPTSD